MTNRFPLVSCFSWTLAGLLCLSSQSTWHGAVLAQSDTSQSQSSSTTNCNGTDCSAGTTTGQSSSSAGQSTSPANANTFNAGQPSQTSVRSSQNTAGAAPTQDSSQITADAQRNAQPTAPTAFQQFIRSSTGHELRVFGSDYFRNATTDFASPRDIAAPADYVLGAGDEVRVHTSGSVTIDTQTTVDRNGLIFIPQVGSLAVAGMRLSAVQDYTRAQIAKQYRNFDVSVTLGRLRSIQIFVLGEARFPGVQNISALSTLINGLFAAGGPAPTGSYRDIQLKRNGRVVAHLDLYDFLLRGEKTNDLGLQPGDIIYVPVVGAQAAVDGDVRRPAIYELRNETSAEALLSLAGGLTPVAATDRASLDRIVNHERRVVQDFPLTGAQNLIQMQDGDLLRVFPISPRFDKAVTLQGNVGEPGRYAWREGMRVSDIIPSRDFLITRRYYNEQNALTTQIPSHPFDANAKQNSGSATQGNGTDATTPATSAQDANRPGTGRALSQAAAAAAASSTQVAASSDTSADLGNHETEINWNYAVIERLDPKDLKTVLVPFALGEAIDNPSSPENKQLQPGDVITVYSQRDINLPAELRARFVRIDGEVMRPGVYRLEGEETLRDLVQRAGGIAPHGYLYAAQFTRESVRLADEAKLQQLTQEIGRDALSPATQQAQASGTASSSDLDLRRAYVNALSQVHATGRVTLHVQPGATTTAEVPVFTLQDGDRFFVPPQPNTVDVLGNVFNAGAQLYVPHSTVRQYLHLAGGKTRTGEKDQEYLLRADGTVLSRTTYGRFDKLLVYPGDTIIVPPKLKAPFNIYQAIGLSQAISSVAITALAISSFGR